MDVKFYVVTKKWDNGYACYYDHVLKVCKTYAEAELFCFEYDGKEQFIKIEKYFERPKAQSEEGT